MTFNGPMSHSLWSPFLFLFNQQNSPGTSSTMQCARACRTAELNPPRYGFFDLIPLDVNLFSCQCAFTCDTTAPLLGAVSYSIINVGICPGSATSDPHLVGASGDRYDVDGEPGGTCSLFSAPQFQVAMHLASDGPGTHFMTQIGLVERRGQLREKVAKRV